MEFIQAANHFYGRYGYSPRFIILHGTAGFSNARDVANYFAQATTEASAHYVIGQDGTVIQCVSEDDAAWANGPVTGPSGTSGNGVGDGYHDYWWDNGPNPNFVTIAIEHQKPHTDNSDQLTPAQKAASFSLIRDICNRHGIPFRRADANGGITGHYSMDPVNRQYCPGPYPWDELLSSQGDEMIQITDPWCSNFYHDLGNGRWQVKSNGAVIGGAIGNYFRYIQAAPRLALTGEQKDPVSGVIYQPYEGGIIVYDPDHKLDRPSMPGSDTCYLLKYSSPLAQRLLSQPLLDQIKAANDETAKALAAEKAAEAQVATLQDQLKAAQPVDKAAIATDLDAAQAAINAAYTKLK